MSTNSNQIDDHLLEQNATKQTKLQKFIRTIDQQTLTQINNYLSQHQNPRNQTNTKTDKIKLYHDLLIIQRFKEQQKNIANKKKIDQLCQQLKNQLHLSAATIRQRIQKKLSNVSKEQILDHIKLQINFTFNTKRKLIPLKQSQINNANQNDIFEQSDIHLDQQQNKSQKISKQSKAISLSSNIQQSSQVQQIPKPKQKKKQNKILHIGNVKQLKKSVRKQQLQVRQSTVQSNTQQLFNQFRKASDHSSDQQILIIKDVDNYKLSTVQAQAEMQKIMNKIKQQYFKINNNGIRNQNKMVYIQKAAHIENYISNNNNQPQQDQLKIIQQQPSIPNNTCQTTPSEQQLYCYCSLQDWKLSNENKQYQYLKWYPDQDQFLLNIINNPNIQQAMKIFQVLKKFKTQQNIVARLKFLNMMIPQFITSTNSLSL